MKKLGTNQEAILRSLVSYSSTTPPCQAPDRTYPGGGWCWDNHSTTVRLLDSLVRRGLVEKSDRDVYRLTPAGRDHITPAYLKGSTS